MLHKLGCLIPRVPQIYSGWMEMEGGGLKCQACAQGHVILNHYIIDFNTGVTKHAENAQ